MLEEAYEQTLAGWAAALDIRDHSTRSTPPSDRLTVALAQRYGIGGDGLADIRRGATLHDIGKMAVPDAVLGKVGPLTDADWALIRQHPEMAHRMLTGIAFLEPAIDIPWCHHEKWDGGGYPRGLAGTDIPFPARLFAVVDVVRRADLGTDLPRADASGGGAGAHRVRGRQPTSTRRSCPSSPT